ncbi:unnamed protein product [Caenorhabditis angaria]|uniref:Uncharacterized protein n=1 Tax=Caenorhabditis angaria TaxID=860376 RepID=A0A9P1MZZ4_9PELO|nr:unnamed protein product [Caenorhabditis angaria]
MENQIEVITRSEYVRLKKRINTAIIQLHAAKVRYKKLEDELLKLRSENLKHEQRQNESIDKLSLVNVSSECGCSGEHPMPMENQTRISGGIEETQQCAPPQTQKTFSSYQQEPKSRLSRFGLEDELGFDPFVESAKGLADLMREESEDYLSSVFDGGLFGASSGLSYQQQQQQ